MNIFGGEETCGDGNQIGGKVIGEGGFGCVLKPGITCNGKQMKSNQFITKIQVQNSTAERELKIGKIVKQIQLYKKRFAPIISTCDYNSKIMRMVSRKEDCSIVSKKPNKKFILSKLPYIKGYHFKKYVSRHVDEKLLHTLIHSYVYLLFSIFLLNKQGIIHCDLKGENVMYDSSRKIPVIIDFGLSLIKEDIMPAFDDPKYEDRLDEYFYIYAPDYYLWCLDIHYVSFLVQHPERDVKTEIPYMVDDYIKYNKIFQKMTPSFVKRFRTLSIEQLNKYEKMGKNDAIAYIIKYCDTWDTYSLSIMFLRFLKLIEPAENNSEFLKMFDMLLSINMHPDPAQRFTSIETYNYMLKYLKNNSQNKTQYKSIIDSIRKNASDIKNTLKKQIKHDDALSHKISVLKNNK
jgi:serine/threonine protein kinase